jgi:hypothetical protein
MNMIPLKEPPQDLSQYVNTVHSGSFDADEGNLCELLKQGTSNIAAQNFALATITKLEKQISESGYKVQFVKIEGKGAFANFYFKKF